MDHVEQVGTDLRFIRLQMTDEVPFDVRRQLADLGLRFLYPIFPEDAQPGAVSLLAMMSVGTVFVTATSLTSAGDRFARLHASPIVPLT